MEKDIGTSKLKLDIQVKNLDEKKDDEINVLKEKLFSLTIHK